ncbi:MAG: phenylalanine--tRNA ligase subunit beta, partial [Clostridiales bacterium]|nr:phenylalanine--tRNA ligase subunit beta [Clostridiales bacterium]
LRGVESNGMLCSLGELGLTTHDFPYADPDGIFLLQGEDAGHPLGTDICTAIGLNDISVEFEITPNRPDCLSVLGLAREAAVTYNVPLRLPDPVVRGTGDDISNYLHVTVENPKLCPRYMAKVIKNVRIAPSPRWMRERLRASGVRPINNIVDITNYVMLEYGQPMHAADLRYIKDGEIIVRNAREGETVTTLDGVERQLTPEMLLITTPETVSQVAGIMGSKYSGIHDDTDTVFFEAANFNGPSVRTTSRKLGLRTESSGKYEKGLDPESCLPAILRACQLVELLDAGDVVDGIIDVDNAPKERRRIRLDPDYINTFLGTDDIPESFMREKLLQLGFGLDGDMITVPSYRSDVEGKADIAEEIARFYGYNNIPTTIIRGAAAAQYTPRQKFERKLNQLLLAQGLDEIATFSFISPKYYDKIDMPADSKLRQSVEILNPLGIDTSVMRTTAVPSMLEVLSRNYSYRNLNVRLYEMATEYLPIPGEQLPEERSKLILGMYGECDFFTLKGVLETLLENIGIAEYDIRPVKDNPTYHPGRCAELLLGDTVVGIFGEIHPAVAENYALGSSRCYVADLDIAGLFEHYSPDREYTPLPKFPAAQRDIAVLCDDDLPVLTMERAVKNAVGPILEKIELFDVYRGSQIPEGKKSVAFNLVLRQPDRTITDEQSESAVKKALEALSGLGAELRN